ncbi:TonB family protein [Desulfuromonas sp.]|uniref:energy transducer TonB n=1 Tax=Desulfuromonas sp. TaxID=892 RepID=UPI0025BFA03E|nr:TonB family protein [Desulfuromonas sp.]
MEIRPPAPPRAVERELDLPPAPEQETPRQSPAKRLGAADQVVKRETAPKGDAPEDRRPAANIPPTPKPAQPARAEPEKTTEQREPLRRPGDAPVPVEPAPLRPQPPATALPDLQALLTLPQTTVARLENQWRSKYRQDVEEGDAVWLDTEKDILLSFFRRLRTNIYNVWNYPRRASERQEEGTCLLKITVRRDGSLSEVIVMESSGYRDLDEEAVEAVRKGAPFGRLPRAYSKETLSIFAFFQYNLMRRAIY